MNEPSLDEVKREASILLGRFLDPMLAANRMDMVRALRPEPEDYARVFIPEVADAARTGYAVLWETLPPWPVRPDQVRLEVAGAQATDFVLHHERAQLFPGGYLSIARKLQPRQIWVCWEFIAIGRDGGVAFDGLVPIAGRWAWFPKPWKVLPPSQHPAPMSHFSD